MDETRRFLRFVVPGVLFAIETLFLVGIVVPEWAATMVSDLLNEANLGSALAALLASGAIGFLLATVHHELHWREPSGWAVMNHSQCIADLRAEGLIDPLPKGREASREEAVATLTIEWFMRGGEHEPIGSAMSRANSFSDLMHSLGTAQVASGLALFVSVAFCLTQTWSPTIPNVLRYLSMLAVGAALICLFRSSYHRTGRMSQQFYEDILRKSLQSERRRAR